MPQHESATYLLSVMEAATRLGLSEETVRRYIRHGELSAIKFGRRVLVHPEDLDAFIDSCRPRSQKDARLLPMKGTLHGHP